MIKKILKRKLKRVGLILIYTYLMMGGIMALLWAVGSNVSWWFVAFQVPGWAWWLLAVKTDNLWLVEWLPAALWHVR